jgi:predicted dehydrogenase
LDYTRQPIVFQTRKALRYTRLYGVDRTIAKVRAQYHMKRRYTRLPELPEAATRDPRKHVGILGCGKFSYTVVAYYLARRRGDVIRGVMDIDLNHAASLAERYGAAYYTDDAFNVIGDPRIDLIYIASNHASHADYAIAALKRQRHVHIEKPHVVSFDQLRRLCLAMSQSSGQVGLGFNRPGSVFGRDIQRVLSDQTGPMMLNWFVAGHELPADHWYHRPEEGGRVLGNLCHWTDFVLQLVPASERYPIKVLPARAAQSDCDIAVSYVFAEGSIATITFSAKGHAFEGVKERFAAHRENVLLAMDDFQTLTVERREHKKRRRLRYRDHGHEASVLSSYALHEGQPGVSVEYVWETGELFLRTREALENDHAVVVDPFPGRAALEHPPNISDDGDVAVERANLAGG